MFIKFKHNFFNLNKQYIKEGFNMSNNLNSIYTDFSKKMELHRLPKWEDLPEIDLYMDQVIVLMEKYLSDLTTNDDNKLITPSMINNYVKLNIMPAPIKKKYSREHIAYLVIICSLKQVMPIPQIKELINLKLKACSIEELLNNFSNLYQTTFSEVIKSSNTFLNDNENSFLDTALFLAIASSNSRLMSESILKMYENNKK
mgnify:FL=1